ncbi:alpha/beta fold hydrolase [Leptospira congkakensis]|uniref:Alpha/beta fold hydrolase n=1 Tax=Leptospira congkakensis TaxID=2484932 RepID=A0A4Z1A3S8_9LEPT|nr:alpha/beta fold hydrolase [Leptospira congkakensis]TGL88543.1 alpha/beta fold hydrolase [Leptospira congkakensis]TGL89129.1 alpha/beta fold hydrolase [Leptospira congkakensis]TGL97095.1 alpha/beta fold hydrolase [Leptospira congkakensis]
MKLAYKLYPFQPTMETKKSVGDIIILHGLFGSSKNWVTVAKALSGYGSVYTVDQRNHGDSPHTKEHSIPLMAGDLEEFILDHKLESPILLGHSMGGLVAMYFDFTHPGVLKELIVQDIAPRSYPFAYEKEIKSMSFPLDGFSSRTDIDTEMAKYLPDTFIRQFLQMSLERLDSGEYRWKLNVGGLNQARRVFEETFSENQTSNTKTLFLIGGISEYITKDDLVLIGKVFSSLVIKIIPEGGHYIHFTHQKDYLKILSEEFLSIL